MSTSYEKKIVSLEFDDSKFKSRAKDASRTLEELNENLKFEDVEKRAELIASSFDRSTKQLVKSSSTLNDTLVETNDNFSKFGDTAENVLTGLQSVTYKIVDQINSAIASIGVSLIKEVTTGGLASGFSMYENRIKSAKTILTNSEGYSLEDINGIFDELNEYANKTIYSFDQMTKSIGDFAARKVDVADAKEAIMGYSNAAAMAGASSEKFSNGLTGVNNAMANGRVMTVQWRSLEYAGISGILEDETKKILAEKEATGELTLTQQEAWSKIKSGTESFRETLDTGWFTNDLLVKTLQRFSDETTELGKKAFAAASEIKTFSNGVDVLKESLASGWSSIWESIFGDANETVALWTEFFNSLGSIIRDYGDDFTTTLELFEQTFKEFNSNGGATAVKDFLVSVANLVKVIGQTVQKAWNNVFGNKTADDLINIFGRLAEFIKMMTPDDSTLDAISEVLELVFDVLKIAVSFIPIMNDILKGSLVIIKEIGSSLIKLLANLFDVEDITAGIETVFEEIKYWVDEIIAYTYAFIKGLADLLSKPEELIDIIKTLGKYMLVGLVVGILDGVQVVIETIQDVITDLKETIQEELEIHSPSLWMMWVGSMMIQGLGLGLLMATPFLAVAISGVIKTITAAFEALPETVGQIGNVIDSMSKLMIAIGLMIAMVYLIAKNTDSSTLYAAQKWMTEAKGVIETVMDCLTAFVSCMFIFMGIKEFMENPVATALGLNGLDEMLEGIGRSKIIDAIGNVVKALSGLIISVGAILLAFTLIDVIAAKYGITNVEDKVTHYMIVMGAIMTMILLAVTLVWAMVALIDGDYSSVSDNKILSKASKVVSKTSGKTITGTGKWQMMFGMAAVIATISYAVTAIMGSIILMMASMAAIEKIMGNGYDAYGKMWQTFGLFAAILGVVLAFITILSYMLRGSSTTDVAAVDTSKVLRKSKKLVNTGSMSSSNSASSTAATGAQLLGLSAVILSTAVAMQIIIGTFTVFAAAMALMQSIGVTDIQLVAYFGLFAAILAVILGFVAVLSYFTKTKNGEKNNLLKISASLIVLSIGIIAIMGAVTAIMIAIHLITKAMMASSGLDYSESLISVIVSIIAILAVITLFIYAISELTTKVLGEGEALKSTIKAGQFILLMGGITLILTAITGVIAVMTMVVNEYGSTQVFSAIGAVLAGLAGAIAAVWVVARILSSIEMKTILYGIGIIALMEILLAGMVGIFGVFNTISKTVNLSNVTAASEALMEMITPMLILAVIVTIMVAIVQTFDPTKATLIAGVLLIVVISAAVMIMANSMAQVAKSLSEMTGYGWSNQKVFTSFIDDYVNAMEKVLANADTLVDGTSTITASLVALSDALGLAFIGQFDSVISMVDEFLKPYEIGSYIASQIRKGLADGASSITDLAEAICKDALSKSTDGDVTSGGRGKKETDTRLMGYNGTDGEFVFVGASGEAEGTIGVSTIKYTSAGSSSWKPTNFSDFLTSQNFRNKLTANGNIDLGPLGEGLSKAVDAVINFDAEETFGSVVSSLKSGLGIPEGVSFFDYISSKFPSFSLDVDDMKNMLNGIFDYDKFSLDTDELFDTSALDASLSTSANFTGTGSNGVTNTYAFYQTNNSPKALSRSEIYRQTKNLFAQQKGVVQGTW